MNLNLESPPYETNNPVSRLHIMHNVFRRKKLDSLSLNNKGNRREIINYDYIKRIR